MSESHDPVNPNQSHDKLNKAMIGFFLTSEPMSMRSPVMRLTQNWLSHVMFELPTLVLPILKFVNLTIFKGIFCF